MRITVRRFDGTLVTKSIMVGSCVRGLRITELTFESYEEVSKIREPPGIKWFFDSVVPAFLTIKQQER